MISTVLYEKKGVITEDRFQKMTPVQWYFHYREIQYHKKREMEERSGIINLLTKAIEYSGVLSHPNINLEQVLGILKSDGQSAEDAAMEAVQYVQDHQDTFPETLSLKIEPKNKNNVKKGRVNKQLGIVIEE